MPAASGSFDRHEDRHDVFVRDRLVGVTERVSVTSGGGQLTTGQAHNPTISGDGTEIAFANGNTDLFPPPGCEVAMHERVGGARTCVATSQYLAPKVLYGVESNPTLASSGR